MNSSKSEVRGRTGFTSLRTKVVTISILMMTAAIVIFSTVSIISERQKARIDLDRNGVTFATFSASTIYSAFTQIYTHPENFDVFRSQVQAILDQNEDIKDVSLVSLSGRILFSTDEFAEGRYSGDIRTVEDEDTANILRTQKELSTRIITHEGEEANEIIVPLQESGGGHILSMRYVLGYESLSGRMNEVYVRTATLAVILIATATVLAAYIGQEFAKPIIEVTRVAEKIRAGDFGARSAHHSNDEIGRLALSLNSMAIQLKSLYQNLEDKVRQRTKDLEDTQVQLLRSVKQHEALLGSIGDGVIATDAKGIIILMNKEAEQMLQVQKENYIGKDYNEIWSLEDEDGKLVNPDQGPIYQALYKSEPVHTSKYLYIRQIEGKKEPLKIPISLSVSPVVADHKNIGMVSVFHDITQEKEVDRMKTEFISLASHQLKTPLSAINWFGEMLDSQDLGALNDEQKDIVMNIRGSVTRMIDLVNALLNISRIEAGRIIVDPVPTKIDDLVQGVVNDLQAKINDKQHKVTVDIQADLPEINLDPHLVGQIYLNLLSNAVKYTPEHGEILVKVSIENDKVVSQVSDNGYGIPPEDKDKMFQKFYRADNILKVETDGTGLGLYLIKSILEASGGDIRYESEINKGTTFWFSLPLSGMKARAGEVGLVTNDR